MRDRDWPEFHPLHAREDGTPESSWQERSDREVVLGIRDGEQRALSEFFRRFQPLLALRAIRAGLRQHEAEDLVMEMLEDFAARMSSRNVRIPSVVGTYLLACLSNRLRDAKREDAHMLVLRRSLSTHGARQATISEYSRRVSRGPAYDPETLSAALARLADVLEEGLSEEEITILMWHANRISVRQIAVWLGSDYEATKKRIYRLRQRVKLAAQAYASHLTPAERRQIEHLVGRAEPVEE